MADGMYPTVSGVPENKLTASYAQTSPYTSGIGVAIPPELAAPAGATMAKSQPNGFPLPGARRLDDQPGPVARGIRDERVASWSAPVLTIDDNLPARVAAQRPGGPPPSSSPSSPAPVSVNAAMAPTPSSVPNHGVARIPIGGGRGGR